jgi:hypothetical protein
MSLGCDKGEVTDVIDVAAVSATVVPPVRLFITVSVDL